VEHPGGALAHQLGGAVAVARVVVGRSVVGSHGVLGGRFLGILRRGASATVGAGGPGAGPRKGSAGASARDAVLVACGSLGRWRPHPRPDRPAGTAPSTPPGSTCWPPRGRSRPRS